METEFLESLYQVRLLEADMGSMFKAVSRSFPPWHALTVLRPTLLCTVSAEQSCMARPSMLCISFIKSHPFDQSWTLLEVLCLLKYLGTIHGRGYRILC